MKTLTLSRPPLRAVWMALSLWIPALAAPAWQPAPGPLMTRWAADVKPGKVHPEYPRPQMVRQDWLNLNGLWDYAVAARDGSRPAQWDGRILVPFPVESALSGVMKRVKETERLWYRRSFTLPRGWSRQRVLLHFGAVDWETTVWVNGKELGSHRGGYDGFSFDITETLKASGAQEIVLAVWDPTDAGTQPRGKQVRNPGGIWYTPTTGIWQTVWLEPVAPTHIASLRVTPDLDSGTVTTTVDVAAPGQTTRVRVEVLDGRKSIQSAELTTAGGSPGASVTPRLVLKVPNAKAWSPEAPFLYGLRVIVFGDAGKTDAVESYFGMRKIAVAKDEKGVNRLFLNNRPLFQFGPLDQGFWPDGLYTAPTDEALRHDIQITKQLGFNMARKHVKIEPARWYYWCDKLGLLVWQDMPSGEKYIGGNDPDIQRSAESGRQFETELKALIDGFYNHPSIVMWVPYNEGWGQWDTARIVGLIKQWDPTRPVNNASGWTDRRVGDVNDIHVYPGPGAPRLEPNRAGVLGEFGGLGLPLAGHTWQGEKNWGYRSYTTREDLTDAYLKLIDRLHPLTGDAGLSAAVYTQTTDVEIEVNGLMTYDRALIKMDPAAVTAANKRIYTPPVPRRAEAGQMIPPATPLVACDPYFSLWSFSDRLTDDATRHWTGRNHPLGGLVRVDGKAYRVIGNDPRSLAPLPQTSLEVLPTRTVYQFQGAGIHLTLTFMNAALPEDLDLLSRPVTYVTWAVKSADGKSHDVALYLDASAELTVNEPRQQVTWARETAGDLAVLKIGTKDQPVLAKKGDDLRIDWGYLYLAAPGSTVATRAFADRGALQHNFAADGLRTVRVSSLTAPVSADQVGAALAMDLGKVDAQPVSRWILLAYDDLYSIQYMKQNLRPYWRRNGWEAADLLQAAAKDYPSIGQRCAALDAELMADLTRAGGEKYARLCALAYRHGFAASKFVADANGQPLSFSKENFSNGCIGTSDVFYPMAPQFLLFGPSLAKSFLVPFMNYAASDRWKFPFAPHDLGTYPHANGQVYGGGERTEENQMPVEESGNLLILMAAVAQMEGNPGFAEVYWTRLEQWAEYLQAKGFDPEHQLCTDDFAGHLAHNVNLSAKAICGLAAFAKLCALRGDQAKAEAYLASAREFVSRWLKDADDGDHFRLAFDRPGTWSQKYNIVWDRILGFNLWPAAALRKELDYYRRIQNRYGLPLDNRATYTKLDWTLWTATLTQNRADFDALLNPVYTWLSETPTRVPLTDWYDTQDGRQIGFQARPVVGGVFLQLLYDGALWKKWAGRDRTQAKGWAPMPKAPQLHVVVPAADREPATWRFTTRRPAQGWETPGFDAAGWQTGQSGFGTRGTPGAVIGTEWSGGNIWLRRDFELTEPQDGRWFLWMHHDEDAEVYLNGVLAAQVNGWTTQYEDIALLPPARNALKAGRNTLAIHCRQTGGGQYIDAGLAVEVPAK